MDDEIKEILAYFEEYVKTTDMHDSEPMLNWKDLKIVLDYITTLQKENKHLNLQLDQALKDYDELQQKIDKTLCCLKSTDGNVFDYMIIEDAIDILKGE